MAVPIISLAFSSEGRPSGWRSGETSHGPSEVNSASSFAPNIDTVAGLPEVNRQDGGANVMMASRELSNRMRNRSSARSRSAISRLSSSLAFESSDVRSATFRSRAWFNWASSSACRARPRLLSARAARHLRVARSTTSQLTRANGMGTKAKIRWNNARRPSRSRLVLAEVARPDAKSVIPLA